MKQRARKVAREIARRLEVNDGDVIMLKRQNEQIDIRLFNALRVAMGKTGKENCVVVVVNDFDEVAAFSASEMRQYGWCRCGQ